MHQAYKDVDVNGMHYQISRVRPHVGSWIISLLAAKMRASRVAAGPVADAPKVDDKATKPTPDESFMATATYLVSQLGLSEQEQVQNLCLERIGRYEQVGERQIALPIMTAGRWAISELEYDGPTVLQLVRESLAFNVAPFFTEAGSSSTT